MKSLKSYWNRESVSVMETVENVEIIEFMKCVDTAVEIIEISDIINIIEITRIFGILTPMIMECNKSQNIKKSQSQNTFCQNMLAWL